MIRDISFISTVIIFFLTGSTLLIPIVLEQKGKKREHGLFEFSKLLTILAIARANKRKF